MSDYRTLLQKSKKGKTVTVIALFENHQLAISDALLTVTDRAISAETPTTGHTAGFSDLEHGVSRLVRKVIAANGPPGRAELLVSGTVTHIEYFATALNQAFRNQGNLPEELCKLVHEDGAYGCVQAAALISNAHGYNEFEVVGVAGDRMCTHTFDANRILVTLPYFGTVWIAGSGAPNLLNWLELRAKRYASHYANTDAQERRFHIANNIPLFLMEEDISPRRRTIKAGVGGYYEAFKISSGMLTPMGDCLTIFADLMGKMRDATVLIRRLMYHCYRDDHMHVLSLKHDILVSAGSSTNASLSDCTLFEVAPLRTRSARSSWSIHRVATQLKGAKIIRTVMQKNEGSHVSTKRFISDDPSFEKLININISGEKINLELSLSGFQYFAHRFSDNNSNAILV